MKGNIYPVYKGGQIVRYQVRFGAKITRSFKSLEAAERMLTSLRHEVDTGKFDIRDHRIRGNPLALKSQGDKWLELKRKILKPKSYANLRRYMQYAYDYFGQSANLKLLKFGQFEDFFYSLPLSDKSRFNARSCLHDFMTWVSKREHILMPQMPTIGFELGWRNIIDLQKQQAIINTVRALSFRINPKIWFGIRCLATYISVRPSELLGVKEGEISLSMGSIVIPHPKEKSPKVVYLLGEDIEMIKSLPRGLPDMYFFRHPAGIQGAVAGRRFGPNYLWVWWKRACAELGIEGVDLYGGTRHSTATALGRVCTPEQIKDATLHRTNAAFERYFQNRQARALMVTEKIKGLRGQIYEFGTETISKKSR